MPVFVWEGRVGNEVQKGEMEAPNKSAVLTRLRQMRIQPIPTRIKPKGRLLSISWDIGGIPTKDIVVFTRQLSTMIDAGLPLVRSLDVLAVQQPRKKFKDIINTVKESVESGSEFADALEKHPKVFTNLYVNLVRAGEAGGVLDIVLQRLADYLEKIESIKRKIRGAMVYPAIVIGVAVAVLAIVIVFVVPVFAEMFKDMGTTLPYLTQVIVDISSFTRKNIIQILITLAIIWILLMVLYKRSKRVQRMGDAFLLKIWLVGSLLQKTSIARFCRTLSTMTSGGIPILDGLEITAKAAGNVIIEEAIMDTRTSVSQGQTIAEPLAKRPKIFPPMVVQMISVGEQTGGLDDMLNKIADFYEDEVDVAVAALMSALEPLMIVFLGGTVGVIVVSMYLPMFKLISTLAG
ncbi:MAG: type II secretion system F family protein [Candidatus Dadabacteria bacterium]|nr:type II secretion system F family protein [Candidatus Dadabacteria bacterium]NIQ13761.1 type II secretion system F family protein [Candidatus Dadabacteria bacterium]